MAFDFKSIEGRTALGLGISGGVLLIAVIIMAVFLGMTYNDECMCAFYTCKCTRDEDITACNMAVNMCGQSVLSKDKSSGAAKSSSNSKKESDDTSSDTNKQLNSYKGNALNKTTQPLTSTIAK